MKDLWQSHDYSGNFCFPKDGIISWQFRENDDSKRREFIVTVLVCSQFLDKLDTDTVLEAGFQQKVRDYAAGSRSKFAKWASGSSEKS
jgi:hypothetical protein